MYDPNGASSSKAQERPSEAANEQMNVQHQERPNEGADEQMNVQDQEMPSQDVHSLDEISDDAMIAHMVELEQASDNPIATQFRAVSSMVFPSTAPTSSQLTQLSGNPVRRSKRARAQK